MKRSILLRLPWPVPTLMLLAVLFDFAVDLVYAVRYEATPPTNPISPAQPGPSTASKASNSAKVQLQRRNAVMAEEASLMLDCETLPESTIGTDEASIVAPSSPHPST